MIEPSLIDGAHVAVVVADDDRRYVHANPAACDLLGVAREDLIGMRVEEITGTPPERIEQAWRRFRDAEQVAGGRVRVDVAAVVVGDDDRDVCSVDEAGCDHEDC